LPIFPHDVERVSRAEDAQVAWSGACFQLSVGQAPMNGVPRILRRLHPSIRTQGTVLLLEIFEERNHVGAGVRPVGVQPGRLLCGDREVGPKRYHPLASFTERPAQMPGRRVTLYTPGTESGRVICSGGLGRLAGTRRRDTLL